MNQPVHTRSAARHLWLTTLGLAASLMAGGRWLGIGALARRQAGKPARADLGGATPLLRKG